MPLPEPAAGLASRGLFPSRELFDRTRSCGVLDSRTASEMTAHRILSPRESTGNNRSTDQRSGEALGLCCGIDWATEHHDIAVVDDDGRVVARGRVDNDAGGFAQLLTLLAEAGDTAKYPIPVGIRNRPRAVGGGIAGDRPVIYPIIPLAASRCRRGMRCRGPNPMPPTRCCWPHHPHRPRCAPTAAPDTELARAIRVAGPRPARRGVGAPTGGQPDP
jgi:hypothetical protein